MTAQRVLDDILADVKRQYPDRDDVSVAEIAACDPEVIRAYRTGVRVKVRNGDWERTGTVSRTTGWSPALILIHRSNDTGSWDVLGPNDRIVAVRRGGRYVETGSVFA